MKPRLESLRDRVSGVDWRRLAQRAGLVGYWSLRVCLGVVVLLYALSFVGPPQVERAEVTYEAPADAARAAVHNLQTATYRVTIEAQRTGGGETARLGEWTRTIDNPSHRYTAGHRSADAPETESAIPTRRYGTFTTGYTRSNASGGAEEGSATAWERTPTARYHPSRNAFGHAAALEGTNASVVGDSADTYTVRITEAATVAELVDVPGHTQQRDQAWNATLTLDLSRDDGRLQRGVYTYTVPESGETVTATYRFEYGLTVDVDRPLGTYPPGEEALTRLDLGVRTVDRLVAGVVS